MNFSIILAPTIRSKAILQLFGQLGLVLERAIILPGSEASLPRHCDLDIELYKFDAKFNFSPNEPINVTLSKYNIPFDFAPTYEVNDKKFIDFLRGYEGVNFIYSGIAGGILKREILQNSGKVFIHSHGGVVPRFSGSTAFYYSILERGTFGATVFKVDEGLDTGQVLYKIESIPHPGLDIDNVQDPVIRAEALALFVRQEHRELTFRTPSKNEERVTYHVIHPTLKHIALTRKLKRKS